MHHSVVKSVMPESLNFYSLLTVYLAAEEMFLKISQALELLSDPAARAAYDKFQATKTAKAIYIEKRRQTDSAKRAHLREELEKRETSAVNAQEEAKMAQRSLEKEVILCY